MKTLILIAALLIPNHAFAAEATMKVLVKIVNLGQMPLDEALAFCEERAIDCSELLEPEVTEIVPVEITTEDTVIVLE